MKNSGYLHAALVSKQASMLEDIKDKGLEHLDNARDSFHDTLDQASIPANAVPISLGAIAGGGLIPGGAILGEAGGQRLGSKLDELRNGVKRMGKPWELAGKARPLPSKARSALRLGGAVLGGSLPLAGGVAAGAALGSGAREDQKKRRELIAALAGAGILGGAGYGAHKLLSKDEDEDEEKQAMVATTGIGSVIGAGRAPRGSKLEGAGRGAFRGLGAGAGAALGAGLASGAANAGNMTPEARALLTTLGLFGGGAAGFYGSGKMLDEPSWEREEPRVLKIASSNRGLLTAGLMHKEAGALKGIAKGVGKFFSPGVVSGTKSLPSGARTLSSGARTLPTEARTLASSVSKRPPSFPTRPSKVGPPTAHQRHYRKYDRKRMEATLPRTTHGVDDMYNQSRLFGPREIDRLVAGRGTYTSPEGQMMQIMSRGKDIVKAGHIGTIHAMCVPCLTKSASTGNLNNSNLLQASFIEKEAAPVLGKALGALGKGSVNKALEYSTKAWSKPMGFVGRGMKNKTLTNTAQKMDDFALRRSNAANNASNSFARSLSRRKMQGMGTGPSGMAARGKYTRSGQDIKDLYRNQKWMNRGMAAGGVGGIMAAPMAAEATGIPGAGTVANATAWGPLWAGVDAGIGAYQGAGQMGAQRATGAVLNHMENAPLSHRLGYLMAPGTAASKVQGMADQYMPGFADYYRRTYGGM